MNELSDGAVRELIQKCWMTHDGTWFLHVLKEYGIEAANRLNKAANRSLAFIEVERIRKAHGLGEVKTFEELVALLELTNKVVKGDFMDFTVVVPSPGTLRFDLGRCFALEGMKRLGVEHQYECGIFNRVEGWFDALRTTWEVRPKILNCMKLEQGFCRREYEFRF
ncbi:MAG: DUF6125 family protein [Pseudomonadota bacterium]